MEKVKSRNARKGIIKIPGVIALLFMVTLFSSCSKELVDSSKDAVESVSILKSASIINIDKVYFAQTHLSEPTEPYFTLVGNRKTLIKAHITHPDQIASPVVKAIVTLNGQDTEIILDGPDNLPVSFESDIYAIQHSLDDGSFTGFIDKDLIQPGMTVKVEADDAEAVFSNFTLRAPTVLRMNYFKVACFNSTYPAFASGWQDEWESRVPVSEMQIEEVSVDFPEMVMVPQDSYIAYKATSKSESNKGEKALARINIALQDAAGISQDKRTTLHYAAAANLSMSLAGKGADFHAVGHAGEFGNLGHECGHALGLAHCNQGGFPYDAGTYGGIIAEKEWVGPNWGFSLYNEKFFPIVSSYNGFYKKTPMLGGGSGDNDEPWALMKHFADYEADKMANKIDSWMVVWNDNLNSWAQWNTSTNDYSNTVQNDGVLFPIQHDVDVYSVVVIINPPTQDVYHIYDPIGPYNSGLIRLFNPNVAQDQADVQSAYPDHTGGFDYTIKIHQDTTTTFAMLPIEHDSSADPNDGNFFYTFAINVPASDGPVTKVKIFKTLDAEVNGTNNKVTKLVWEP